MCFNAGVELGQLAVVLATVAVVRIFGARLAPLQRPATYAIGALATCWLLQRTLPMFTAG